MGIANSFINVIEEAFSHQHKKIRFRQQTCTWDMTKLWSTGYIGNDNKRRGTQAVLGAPFSSSYARRLRPRRLHHRIPVRFAAEGTGRA